MVNVQLTLALFLLVSSTVRAALPPSIINGTVTKAGVTTTYSVEPSTGSYQTISPASYAPSGSTVLSNNVGVQNGAYVRGAAIPVGETIAGIKVGNSISASNLASAAVALAKKASALGIAMVAGSALYDYLNASNVVANSDGTLASKVNKVGNCSELAYCDNVGSYCTASDGRMFQTHSVPYGVAGVCPSPDSVVASCSSYTPKYYSCRSEIASIPPNTPITDQEAQTKLESSTYPGTSAADALVKQLVDQKMAPSYTSPGTISGPASVNQPDHTTVNPDGSVSKRTGSIGLTYPPGTGTIQATSHETVTTTKPDGTTTTSTYDESVTFDPIQFDDPTVIPNSTTTGGSAGGGTTQTDCEKFPSSAGCANLGDAPAPDTIQTQTPTFSITPVSVGGSGSCPAAKTFNVSGHTYSLSFDYICQGAGMLSAVILAISWMIAGYIVFGSVRSN